MHNSQRNEQYYANKNLSDNYRIPFQRNDRMIIRFLANIFQNRRTE